VGLIGYIEIFFINMLPSYFVYVHNLLANIFYVEVTKFFFQYLSSTKD
jgi:hypothetical protein